MGVTLRPVALRVGVMLALLAAAQVARAEVHEFTRLLMGVQVRVLIDAEDGEAARIGAAAAFDRIAAIEEVASDWRASSEVMRLCAGDIGRDVDVSADLMAMLACGRRVSMASGGAFDVTIGPVTHAWRRARAEGRAATEDELREARQRVGWRGVVIDEARGTVRLTREGIVIDLGGIAQGYAAREALAVLRSAGLGRACVDVSGDIAMGDAPTGREGWRVAVAWGNEGGERGAGRETGADTSDGGVRGWRVLTLRECAVSTSGDSEQAWVVERGGVDVLESHIIDPASGRGVVGMRSVTVIGPDAMVCDALATAVSVMGAERGIELARRAGYRMEVAGGR